MSDECLHWTKKAPVQYNRIQYSETVYVQFWTQLHNHKIKLLLGAYHEQLSLGSYAEIFDFSSPDVLALHSLLHLDFLSL